MASSSGSGVELRQMSFRFEFDGENNILLGRFEGRLTEEMAVEFCRVFEEYVVASGASTYICDLSSVIEFAVGSNFLRGLALREPVMRNATRPRFLVAPTTAGYGLMRMFQLVSEPARPLLHVVRTVDEAIVALGIQSPRFDPYE
jgi:hypothetical protein